MSPLAAAAELQAKTVQQLTCDLRSLIARPVAGIDTPESDDNWRDKLSDAGRLHLERAIQTDGSIVSDRCPAHKIGSYNTNESLMSSG